MATSKKPLRLSRRSFAKRTGMLLSSLGLGASVQSGLMDAILKKANARWGGEALAGTSQATVRRVLEICIRAGFQMNSLFPSAGHLEPFGSPNRSAALNVYSSPGNIGVHAGYGGRPLHIAKFERGGLAGEGAQGLAPWASYIATSEAIDLTNGHTEDWRLRRPSGGSPVPAVLHNAYAPPSAVRGVLFGNGGIGDEQTGLVFNRPGNLTAGNLTSKVAARDAFLRLYGDSPIYFSREELRVLIGTIQNGQVVNGRHGAVGDLDAMFLQQGVDGADDVFAVTLAGRGQAQFSLRSALAIDGLTSAENNGATSDDPAYDAAMVGAFGGLAEMTRMTGGTPIGLTLASIVKGWKAQALTTAVVALNSNDWHNFDDAANVDNPNAEQGMWNIALGNALRGLLQTLSVTPDPYEPSKMMSDSFLVIVSSEFTRTPERTDSDPDPVARTNNNDGGTQGFALIGSKVKGGTYGDITPGGGIMGFDPMTGNPAAMRPKEASIYKAIGRLMGIDGAIVDAQVGGSDPVAQCLIR